MVEMKWSGKGDIPKQGARVKVTMNGLGAGTVVSHFFECGFIGVKVDLDSPPEWFTKQNDGNVPAMVFGAEVESLAAG
jgi:hypothetical protein